MLIRKPTGTPNKRSLKIASKTGRFPLCNFGLFFFLENEAIRFLDDKRTILKGIAHGATERTSSLLRRVSLLFALSTSKSRYLIMLQQATDRRRNSKSECVRRQPVHGGQQSTQQLM